ncbi:hypothetical protein U5817_11855 [Aromatoleum evansii]|uniref:Secreted protein n=1 Tax=Aromatoleum evansii TaxID=59406 RepID=A0ABZ1ATC8_AROEV|nr:hypothetical protein U5817_11855 [Aromatoleum evansii]
MWTKNHLFAATGALLICGSTLDGKVRLNRNDHGQARAFQCRFFSSKLETEGEDEIFNALLGLVKNRRHEFSASFHALINRSCRQNLRAKAREWRPRAALRTSNT